MMFNRTIIRRNCNASNSRIADTLNNIAAVYHTKGQLDLALDYYNQSLAVSRETLPENHSSLEWFGGIFSLLSANH